MKPSERVKEICLDLATNRYMISSPTATQKADVLPYAIAKYLDEEAERRAKWEQDIERKLKGGGLLVG